MGVWFENVLSCKKSCLRDHSGLEENMTALNSWSVSERTEEREREKDEHSPVKQRRGCFVSVPYS